MTAERCREPRELLGAYVLGRLEGDERVRLEAHLEGCDACRMEADSLAAVARLLPHADPERIGGGAPAPPAGLGDRVAAGIARERRAGERRSRRRFTLRLGAAAAAAAAALALFLVIGRGSDEGPPHRSVEFTSLPGKIRIGASVIPQPHGTEIHMYVHGIRPGTLCRVSMRGPGGREVSAGTFRYSREGSAVLSAALSLREARALVIRAGRRTFVAPL